MSHHLREHKLLGTSRGSGRGRAKETPRITRAVRELRNRHASNPAETSQRDDAEEEEASSLDTSALSGSSIIEFDIDIDAMQRLRAMDSSAELPASLSVFPRTPATISRPSITYATTTTATDSQSDLNTSPLFSRQQRQQTPETIASDDVDGRSAARTMPHTPLATSAMSAATRQRDRNPASMVTPLMQRNTLFASQLVPVSGNGYIASAEPTPYPREQSPHATEEAMVGQAVQADAMATPCVRRARHVSTAMPPLDQHASDVEEDQPAASSIASLYMAREHGAKEQSDNAATQTTSNDEDLRVLVQDTPPSPMAVAYPPCSLMDDPVTCITDTPSDLMPLTAANRQQDATSAIETVMPVTQPTQIINLPPSAEDGEEADAGTIPTLILSRTPSPVIKRTIPAYHRHVQTAVPLEQAAAAAAAAATEEKEAKQEKPPPAEDQSFQFHTPTIDTSNVTQDTPPRETTRKHDDTMNFSAFLKQQQQQKRQKSRTDPAELSYSDSELPSHITIDDPMLIDRLIESDPVMDAPMTADKKRARSATSMDEEHASHRMGSSMARRSTPRSKRHRQFIQRDRGFDQASNGQSSMEAGMTSLNHQSNESNDDDDGNNTTMQRQCEHCSTSVTTSWRKGPAGAATLCQQCGSFYAVHRILPTFRGSKAPRQSFAELPDYLPGDRVWAYSHHDGYYHSATVKGDEEHYAAYRVVFDDRRHHMTERGLLDRKPTVQAEHLRPLDLVVNARVWVMRMGERELQEARVGVVDLDEERCRVYWLQPPPPSSFEEAAKLSPWISISRIALPASSTADEEEEGEGEAAPSIKPVDDVPVDVTSSEFIDSLLGSPPNPTTDDAHGDAVEEEDEDVPADRRLFKDMTFVLTNIPSQSESYKDNPISCTKEALTHLIQEHGGFVESNMLGVYRTMTTHTTAYRPASAILICGEVKRTKKHLLALALDIPRISYRWIIDAVKQNRVDMMLNYALCNGYSNELNAYVASRHIATTSTPSDGDGDDQPGQARLLAGLVVHLKGSTTFKSDWEAVLTAAGAAIVDHKQLRSIGCDYIVLEKRPTRTWLDNLPAIVRSRIKAIVTSEWVAQCLINQRVVDWQQHASYTQWS
ncbi:hypothetical protein SYNPS1DRAFT_27596 [Syncephalis pseudoplumigaleata]|uniref:BRCT domain-containing protein n=1 Tax=Syncephalis pseudoplumigaleata TaxID=1712513 RepID=A0A4P9Z2H3_9FUNG|nr:hypothetical protein SYNPS1DRAFT_27596 [Syncephalis pseudoplumigaleata]|eukprot:RKP26727.1 hypothetical protein SYNPS1DRAFT_27596 [Syncephalis pseudoplumigaleata]